MRHSVNMWILLGPVFRSLVSGMRCLVFWHRLSGNVNICDFAELCVICLHIECSLMRCFNDEVCFCTCVTTVIGTLYFRIQMSGTEINLQFDCQLSSLSYSPWHVLTLAGRQWMVKSVFSEHHYEILFSNFTNIWHEHLGSCGIEQRSKV